MNRSLLAFCFASPLLAFVGCALDEQKTEDDVPATGGAAGSGTPTGGSAGSGVGGSPATGGANPTGGTAGSSAGGLGGTVTGGGTGGMGTGGDLGGSGGMPPGGSGGMPPGGSGGMPPGGSGGNPPGGSGGNPPGGSAGMPPGGSGGGGTLTPESVVPGLDGYTQSYPCGGGDVTNYDCVNSGCMNGQDKEVTRDFMVTGAASTTYELTFRVRGVVEAKNYTGGMRRAGNGAMDAAAMGGDFLYTGGSAPDTTYNEYSLRVQSGAVTGQPSFYGMNARNGTSEVHESWALNFTFTLRVHGGGVIRYRMFDSNCRQITNCGTGTGSTTCGNDQRILTFAGADPMPMNLNQPYLGAATAAGPGQWIFFDVTSVTVVP